MFYEGADAMRSILHVDMNNFYASVECLYRPEIRGYPVAVAGDPENRHGIILAKNMIAKLELYAANDFFAGVNLLTSQESYEHPLNTVYVERVVRKFLL